MQGVYVNGSRAKSKKEVKAALASKPDSVRFEATSIMGNEYDGPASEAPEGKYYVVGPDPYHSRKWYAAITVKGSGKERAIKVE